MSSDVSTILSTVKWSDSSNQLKDFCKKYDFPQIVKIIKGQYMTVGAPSLSSPSLNQIILLGSVGKRVQVIAQSVRFKESRNTNAGPNGRVVPIGPKLAIPDNYDGWWEILSEEGKSVRCIESVGDLAKKNPETCLVRDGIKAHVAKHEDPNEVSDKVRTIQSGELLTLLGTDVLVPNTKSNKYLKCRSSKGDIIFFNLDQKGKFSPVAKEGISGVHSIGNLLTKRLPLMVRLVYGKPPQGFKNFCSDLRLYSSYEEECVVAMPLVKDNQSLIQVPIGSGLKILCPKNANDLCEMSEFRALKDLCEKLKHEMKDKIHLLDIQLLSKDLKASLKDDNNNTNKGSKGRFAIRFQGHQYDHKRRLQSNFLVKRSLSDPQQIHQTIDCEEQLKRGKSLDDNQTLDMGTDQTNCPNDEKNYFYDEIDQIYDYVRGFAPLPQSIKSDFQTNKPIDPNIDSMNKENKPESPPVITIPSIQSHRMSYPMSSQKLSVNVKKVKKYFPNKDNIFAKSNKKEEKMTFFPNVRIAYNNNSGNRIYLPTAPAISTAPQPNYHSANGPKLFVKNSSGQRNTWKGNRFLKYAKHVSSSFRNESINEVKQQKNVLTKESVKGGQTCRSSRSLTTSPIFNIRYKSLNNLHYITSPALDYNNTLDSSHSGQTSSGSGSKDLFRDPKTKYPKLSRSLTNVFWDMSGNVIPIDTLDKLNNELNERKNKNSFQLMPVHFDFLNALDRLQQQQNQQQLKDQSIKSRQMATLYL